MDLSTSRVVAHITFFFVESRLPYLKTAIAHLSQYKCARVDIFVHCNQESDELHQLHTSVKNANVTITPIIHNLLAENPFWLTWKCRPLIEKQLGNYEIFIYLEDDIAIPFQAVEYWNAYKPIVSARNMDVGFLRIEQNTKDLQYYSTDQPSKLARYVTLHNRTFVVLDSPYCAFWIYDAMKMIEFVKSDNWTGQSICYLEYLNIRENSAIGMKHKAVHSIIPIESGTLHEGCFVYHLPNNYANNPDMPFGKVAIACLLDHAHKPKLN